MPTFHTGGAGGTEVPLALSLSLCPSQPWHLISASLLGLLSPCPSFPPSFLPPLLCQLFIFRTSKSFPSLPKPLTFTLWNQNIFYFSFPERGFWVRFPQGCCLPFWRQSVGSRAGLCQPSTKYTNQQLLGTHCIPGPSHELSHSVHPEPCRAGVSICTQQMNEPRLGAVKSQV